ncbi:hypothetical protein Poly51_02090 [Rubripirellula tenax]|uniref:Uncharacterized protein n=1 Tax=Rubripirellula tenax TaxID=2528015 RepID=A0A5C6FDQ7_9BACT|nr:membrane or secreted protein [Rubripirellula tenax]TWU59936.1 hypothetical protein Poly51_02090 [Rubripirellula tenax]
MTTRTPTTARPINGGILIAIGSLIVIGCGPSGRDLSDQQWLEMQNDMQQERAEVGQQRDQLETDRREWDQRERSDAILAAVIASGGLLLACGLPLLVVAILLWPRPSPSSSEAVCDVLLDEVVQQAATADGRRIESTGVTPKLGSRD